MATRSRTETRPGRVEIRLGRDTGGMAARPVKLDESEVEARLGALTGWERSGDVIHTTFERVDFPAAIAFVVNVGFWAEAANHHPDIDVRWRTVHIALTTHDAGGLTTLDFELAAKIDELAS